MAKNISNLDKSLKQNITPADIGAAASSHETHLTLGTGSGNAYRGDYGNTAYNHSQASHAPSNAQKNSDITKAEIEAKLTGNITSHSHSTYATTSTTGSLSSLQTSAKGSLVAAINEVFQSGNNAKQKLVDALSAQGVSASTSDSWDVLTSKINGVSTGLHAVAVSSLPATGAANTIYVITNNPQNIIISNNLEDCDFNSNDIFIRLETSETNTTKIQTTKDNTTINYYVVQALQSRKGLESYIYENAAWKKIVVGDPIYLYNGVFIDDKNLLGDVSGNSYWKTVDGTGVVLNCSTSTSSLFTYNSYGVTFENQIDFSLYKKIVISVYGANLDDFYVFKSTEAKEWYEDGDFTDYTVIKDVISPGSVSTNVQEFTIDISQMTGLGYFGVGIHESMGVATTNRSIYITDLKFIS